MKFYYVYVLLLKGTNREKFYIGYCNDLIKRWKRHFKKEIKSTKGYSNIRLIYYEACLNKIDAMKRELQLKTGFGRGYLKRRLKEYLKQRD